MRNILVITLFMLATRAWAAAQQPGTTADPSSGQTTSPGTQAPSATQPQSSTPSTDQEPAQTGPQAPSQRQAADVAEGCLGGSNPNYTITDSTGNTYKLNIPPSADTSKLAAHVGESVNVAGNVKPDNTSIDVKGIGRGTGKCPAGGSRGVSPPKQ